MSIKRYEMTDEQWEQISSLFPISKTGRPPKNNRLITSYVLICITSLFRISHDGITLNSVTATAVLERREAVHLATRLSLSLLYYHSASLLAIFIFLPGKLPSLSNRLRIISYNPVLARPEIIPPSTTIALIPLSRLIRILMIHPIVNAANGIYLFGNQTNAILRA